MTTSGVLALMGGGSDRTVSALARREPAAVARVYDEYHATVRAFAMRILGDGAAAEDLVHDVFVELPDRIRRLRDPAKLRSFILGIAANRARHLLRSRRRRESAGQRLREATPGAATSPTPEDVTARRQLALRLQRAIETLPEDQRIAFVLRDVEDRSAVEVAAILGVPDATIRTRVFHARRKLRALLEEDRHE